MALTAEEEKDIESVAQPNTVAAYVGSDAQIGDAFEATEADSFQVEDTANERLAKGFGDSLHSLSS